MTKFKYWIPAFIIMVSVVIIVMILFNYNKEDDGKFSIVTTFYPVELIVDNIIKDVETTKSTNISASVGGCVHDYDFTSNDMKKIEKADLIVINGQDMEHFIEKVTTNNKIVDSSSNIPNKDISSHIWMDLDNYISQIKYIGNALCTYDTENADTYTKNMNEYISKVEQLKNSMNIKSQQNVAIMHDSFKYYANMGMFNVTAELFTGHEGNYSANELKTFIGKIKETNTQKLFIDNETYEHSKQLIASIANETGINIYILDLIVEVNANQNQYIEKMTNNIKVIKEAVGYVE